MINRVFFIEGQFDAIRQRAETDAHVKMLVDTVLKEAETTSAAGELAFAYYSPAMLPILTVRIVM